jgi:hypothetical protein
MARPQSQGLVKEKSQPKRKVRESRPQKFNKSHNGLAEKIAAAGGISSDLELVKGSREDQMIQGYTDEDVR